jgi:hypothetical protein
MKSVQFLTALFGPRSTGPVFVTSLANEKSQKYRIHSRWIASREVERIEKFVAKWDQPERALYFCVSTVRAGQQRSKDTVVELTCLFADLDFKTIEEDGDKIKKVLRALPLPPQLVNFSGHGLHCYWPFDVALPATGDNIERVERLLTRLADVLAGDPAVCEVARLMRLPGSHNTKNGEWTEVKTIVKRPGCYTLAQLEAWLKDAKVLLTRRHEEKTRNTSPSDFFSDFFAAFKAPIDVDQRLAEMQHHGPGETSIHQTQLSVTAALLKRGLPIDDVVSRVLKATVAAAGREGRKFIS